MKNRSMEPELNAYTQNHIPIDPNTLHDHDTQNKHIPIIHQLSEIYVHNIGTRIKVHKHSLPHTHTDNLLWRQGTQHPFSFQIFLEFNHLRIDTFFMKIKQRP